MICSNEVCLALVKSLLNRQKAVSQVITSKHILHASETDTVTHQMHFNWSGRARDTITSDTIYVCM